MRWHCIARRASQLPQIWGLQMVTLFLAGPLDPGALKMACREASHAQRVSRSTIDLIKVPTMNPVARPALGRNDPCYCGSGRKYKACCLNKDEAAARAARAQAAAEEASTDVPATSGPPAQTKPPKPQTQQPWKRAAMNTRGYQRHSSPRKVGGS